MSIRKMMRKCEHCGFLYPYNPSVGNFGRICPRCRKWQYGILPTYPKDTE